MAYYGRGIHERTFNEEGREFYYIHRHISHFEMDEALELFNSQKKQNYAVMKSRYKENFLKNVQIDRKAYELLNSAMSEEELVSMLDKSMLTTLDNMVGGVIQSYDLDSRINQAFESLDKYLQSEDLKDLDQLFAQITAATKFLNTDIKPLTTLIGMTGDYKKHRNLRQLDEQLLKTIDDTFGTKSKGIKIVSANQARFKSVLSSLQKLVHSLSTAASTPNNNIINKQSLQKYLTNIFSTQIGEYIVSSAVATAMSRGLGEVRKSLTGGKRVKYTEDQALNNFIKAYGNKSRTFKTDNSFTDLDMEVDINGQTMSASVNLGLSTKWYKNNGKGITDSVSLGTEASFSYRLNQLFDNDSDKYLAYNALALTEQDGRGYAALKAALVARNADMFMSGMGVQGDFSQYISVNGKFYSMWQILTLLENYNRGEGSTQENSGTDPVTISATGLSAVLEVSQERLKEKRPSITKAYARAKQQNLLIENLGLQGHFYPNRFKNLT